MAHHVINNIPLPKALNQAEGQNADYKEKKKEEEMKFVLIAWFEAAGVEIQIRELHLSRIKGMLSALRQSNVPS